MKEFFLAVVNMSLTGGIVIVAVMIVRLCLRRAPKIFSYLLWGVVLLRLLCPVSFSSVISVFQVVHVPVTEQGSMLNMPQRTVQAELPDKIYSVQSSISHSVNHPVKAIDKKETVRLSWDFEMACSIVWITGVVVLWMYSVVSMFRLKRKLIGAVLDEKNAAKNIYLSDYIGTAFVMGVLRPRIYLPTTLTEAERRYILLHEKTHIK
ncbi:MAG: M56 family metallopeptidase, partial [Lachnospiraceae bacterium]|nr:M56 family metallopeptidase [Lachnospiraceae bacterium]